MFCLNITFVRDLSKRLWQLEKLESDDANVLTPFCPTRWILRKSGLTSVEENLERLGIF